MTLWFIGVFWAVLLGVLTWSFGRWFQGTRTGGNPLELTWVRAIAAMAVCSFVIIPTVDHIGTGRARGSLLRYEEFWGGYELAANRSSTPCSRDGSCEFTYSCDSYTVTTVVPDADGKGSHTESHTEYHSCPYATEEWDFAIDTTLGGYHIERTFPDHARKWPDCDHDCDPGLPGDVRQGVPPFWQAAADRLAAHDPGPVTALRKYDNFILASSRTILKKYGSAVERYKTRKLLPGHTTAATSKPIHDYYYADKMLFAGMKERPGWQAAMARFNAALGSDLEGDLHVVVANARRIDNPDDYAGALNAYWQSKEFGKRSLSKNGIGLVLGVRNGRVTWARAFTGMPIGNDAMKLDIRNELKGVDFDPETILGHPKGTFANGKMTVDPGDGVLAKILWGEHKFKRICMRCKEEGGTGYTYLKGEIEPTAGQRRWMIAINFLLSLIVWAVALFVPGRY